MEIGDILAHKPRSETGWLEYIIAKKIRGGGVVTYQLEDVNGFLLVDVNGNYLEVE